MFEDGSQDISFVKNTLRLGSHKPIYIIKSTVLPKTTEKLNNEFKNLKIVFSPEFLTERTSKLDMLTQPRIIIGGEKKLTHSVSKLFSQRFKGKNIILTDSTTAELIKYMNNTFFATKVSVMNEFKLLSNKLGAN